MIIQKFQQIVREQPDQIAIKTAEQAITYKDLNRSADILAWKINNKYKDINSQKEKKIIALLFEHGKDMIIGMIGALKATTIYVPMDPLYPVKRLTYMFENSEADFIVTNNKNYDLAKKISANIKSDIKLINMDEIYTESYKQEVVFNTEYQLCNNNIAYILYTSGSTGMPKGIYQSTKNINHFIQCYIKTLGITNKDRMTLFSSFSHDASIMDMYSALLSGTTIYPLNIKNQSGIDGIGKWLEDERITIWHSVPTVYRYFINTLDGNNKFNDLRFIVLGGENVILHDIELFQKFFTETKLVNLYGQTESSFNSAQIYTTDSQVKRITLGNIVDDTEIIVVNENREEVSPLNIGEIVVLSDYVALGYWKDIEKTKEVFQENKESGKMYWTGDLGKLLLDGTIEFAGRKNSQIKIRGYRVEPGEIESRLLNIEAVKEAVVIGKRDTEGNNYLCAYFTADNPYPSSSLYDYLKEELPDYMLPTYFIQLEKLPTTPNGKIDRQALPEVDYSQLTDRTYTVPRNEIEKELVSIWKEFLSVDTIGIDDNFFEIGGHSLKATFLISRIHKSFHVTVPLGQFFQRPTIEAVSEYIITCKKNSFSPITKVGKQDYYHASPAQKRMFLLQQFDSDGTGYNMPFVTIAEGHLDINKLENSIHQIIMRHDILRTSFEIAEDKVLQKVHDNFDFNIEIFELSSSKKEEDSINEVIGHFIRPFDLSKAPLLRAGVIKWKKEKHILLLDIHHIISDGVSMGILIDEIVKCYQEIELDEIKIQYKDYANWQNLYLDSKEMEHQKAYWIDKFSDEIPVLNLPVDYKRPQVQSLEGESLSFCLGNELTESLISISKKTGSTLYMILLSGINILLSKYTGQEDIIIGSPIAGRSHTDIEKVIGVFVNTLPMRNYPKGNQTYKEFLEKVKENALKAYENQDYQFDDLVEELNLPRDISRNPLFDVMFSLQNFSTEIIELDNLTFKPYGNTNKIAKTDLSFTAIETDKDIDINIDFSKKLFKRQTIERMRDHFLNIINILTDNLKIKLNDINMITEEEFTKLSGFNQTYADYEREKTICQLFEEQAARSPKETAVVFKDKSITYEELNEKINRMARTLRAKGVGSGTIVGFMVNRSIDMIIGIMAILRSGGVYSPIDPSYPKDRIEYMLKDSKAGVLLQGDLKNNITFDGMVLNIHDEAIYSSQNEVENETVCSSDRAYVIYTSGSTGNPKGVIINHRALNNFGVGVENEIKLSKYESILCLTTINFDIFILESLIPLTTGVKIVIADEIDQTDPLRLNDIIIKNQIKVLQITPSRLQLLMMDNRFDISLNTIKAILIGGESLPFNLFKKLKTYQDLEIYNMYGPTETTVWSAIARLTDCNYIHIGKPMSNTRIYITDSTSRHLQPIGISGELCIAGDGLAEGYLDKEELTADKFIQNYIEPDSKMYRTGDLARWMPDGTIEFLGRIDHQVKIRGFRIELGEIENRLLDFEDITDAVVIDHTDKNGIKYLCSYIVSSKKINVSELRAFLQKKLPDYMIPSYFVQMDKLPLTPNGKTNRKALPIPDSYSVVSTEYEEASNVTEEKLVQIWKSLLAVQDVGINDNFFDLGGYSLKAVMLSSQIYKEFHVELPIHIIFKVSTIKELALCIDNNNVFDECKYYAANQKIVQLKESQSDNIFLLPPTLGYGLVYNEFAGHIKDYGVYSFDFIEEENRMEQYMNQIFNIHKDGKCVLLGHSSGGNLVFELTKYMEIYGYEISDIILLDSPFKDKRLDLTSEDYNIFKEVMNYVRHNLNISFILESIEENIQKKSEAFIPYWNNLVNNGKISANIHFLTAKDLKDSKKAEITKWSNLTRNKFIVYKGYGEHGEMLEGEFGKLNAQIVNHILKEDKFFCI